MCLTSILVVFRKINTRRTIGQRRVGAAVGDNQVPPQAAFEGVAMPVNLVGLTDAEVTKSPSHMAQAITIQA